VPNNLGGSPGTSGGSDQSVFKVFNQVFGPANLDAQWGRRTPDEPAYTSRVEDLHDYTLKGMDVAWIQPPPGCVAKVLRQPHQRAS
jgi:hypothetical protein